MRISYGPWGETLDELLDVAHRAEQAGAEVLWVQELHRSATIQAAALASATERAQIGIGIALAFTRSPMITALEALDIDELSGGRLLLGLGSGVQRLIEDWHNASFGKPVAHLRETVRDVREFWRLCRTGEAIDLPGEWEPIRIRGYQRPFPVTRTEIPVYLAAMGPAMTRMAGAVADGWISHELCSPRYLTERIFPELDAGIATVPGRSRSDLDVVVSACCSVSDDEATAVQRVSGLVGFYASVRTYADFFEFHGLGEEQQRVIDAFRAGTGADHLAGTVSPDMVHALTFAGTRAQVVQRIAEYEGLADTIKISPPTHGLPAAETRAAQDELIGLIAEITGSAS
jgi:probable F420-dependent oxidoreductase